MIRGKRRGNITTTGNNMQDLHTHILPQIDDGASSVEEALQMTEELDRREVKTAVCTPHFNARRISLDEFLQKRTDALARLKDSKISLRSGSEVTLNDYIFHYPDLSPLCIQDTNYILLELPFTDKWDPTIYAMLEKIIQYYSLCPIIAHIERYPAANRKVLKKLSELGCYLQVNAHSILQDKSWHHIKKYMKRGYIDIIASDCHNMTSRPPILPEAYQRIKQELGDELCRTLVKNAEVIIGGEQLRDRNLFTI